MRPVALRTRGSARVVQPWVALLVALAGPATPSAAQAVYGSIAGTVADSSGARAPGASVTVTSLDRGTVDTVTSNASGYYLKERLLPGRYELKAELRGFRTQVVALVVVGVDAQTRVDPVLEPGDVNEAVTVSATGGQLLKTDRADVATSFEAKQVTDLPVLERNFTRFVLLTPGAQEQPWQHASAENPQGSVQTMVNGQHFSGTGYQLDGTDNRDPILGLIVINPTLESVGEAKVTSQNYDAEFGQAIAGVVSVLTRSGANELHGSAFEFLQRDQFQARNPFTQFQTDPATGRYIPETKRDQFGGSLGGPSSATGGSSSPTTKDSAASSEARGCSTSLRSGRGQGTSATTESRSSTPPPETRPCASRSRATSFRRGDCRRKRSTSSRSSPSPMRTAATTARGRTTSLPGRRHSTATPSTFGWMGASRSA